MDVPWRRDFDAARDPYTARNALGITTTGGGGISDAPSDGTLYGRLNGTWSPAQPAGSYAPINSPTFTGDPKAPTPTAGDNDTSIATTAFVTNAISTAGGSYQPLDGDLTSIASYGGTGTWLYRSAANTWSAVTFGSGLTFTGGALAFTEPPSDGLVYGRQTVSGVSGWNQVGQYTEGTWTPTVTFATPGDLSVVYSARNGIYTKVGRLVITQFDIQTTTFTYSTALGSFQITGLPFTSAATYRGSGNFSHLTGVTTLGGAAWTMVAPRIDPSGTTMTLAILGVSSTAIASLAHFTSGTNLVIRGFAIYTT